MQQMSFQSTLTFAFVDGQKIRCRMPFENFAILVQLTAGFFAQPCGLTSLVLVVSKIIKD